MLQYTNYLFKLINSCHFKALQCFVYKAKPVIKLLALRALKRGKNRYHAKKYFTEVMTIIISI